MTLYEFFIQFYPAFCLFYLNAAILAVVLPNHIVNTESPNKHLIMIFLVVAGMAGLRPDFMFYSLVILGFMFSGIAVHYVRAWQKNKIKSYTSLNLPDAANPLYKRVK